MSKASDDTIFQNNLLSSEFGEFILCFGGESFLSVSAILYDISSNHGGRPLGGFYTVRVKWISLRSRRPSVMFFTGRAKETRERERGSSLDIV